jgi:hypothetical protein
MNIHLTVIQNSHYSRPMNEMCGTCSTHVRDEKYVQNFVGKPECNRPLGRARRRWEDNIVTDLR